MSAASKKTSSAKKAGGGTATASATASGGKKRGASAKAQNAAAEPVTTETMTREQLLEEVKKLQTEINSEREERNFFQIERDRVLSFWEITKAELKEAQAQLQCKDNQIEDLQEKHMIEIKVYKQKVKHLLYEYQNNAETAQIANTETLNSAAREHDKNLEQLRAEKRALKLELREIEIAHNDVIRNLKARHDAESSAQRSKFEHRARELSDIYNERCKTMREETELRRKNEIHEIEERKNSQINALMRGHEKAFAEIKNYYNDITLNNLALINSLKEQVEEMKKKEERNEKLMSEVTNENKRLSEPLQSARNEVEQLRRQLVSYEKDKLALRNTMARLRQTAEAHKALVWEHDILAQRMDRVQAERDDLYAQFALRMTDVQQKCGFRALLLERKLEETESTLEKRELALTHALSSLSETEPEQKAQYAAAFDRMIEEKDTTIRQLRLQVARVTRLYNDLLRAFRVKAAEHGICLDEYRLEQLAPVPPPLKRASEVPLYAQHASDQSSGSGGPAQ